MKKITKSDLGINYAGMPEEQRIFLEKMADVMVDAINKANDGEMSMEQLETKFKGFSDQLDTLKGTNETIEQLKKDNADLLAQLKSLGEAVEKAQQKGVDVNPVLAKYNEAIDNMFESEKFKSFLAGTTRDARNFEIKEVSMSGNYTGELLITQQSNDVVTAAKSKAPHIRDFATVLPGDPQMLQFAWQQIYELDRNARYVSENGMLPESSFKIKEEVSAVKRVGHHFKMSKRMLKSRLYVRAFILTQVVNGVLNTEDFGFVWGDGEGDNIKGITKYDGCKPVETIIGTAIETGTAGTIESLAAAGNGVIVTFKKAYDLMQDGMKITFAGATTNTSLNTTCDVIKLNDRQILLEGKTLTGTESQKSADAAAMTWTVKSGAYQSVETPNSYDALETAIAVMTYAQYNPTVIMLNPLTINAIRCEKATNGNRLDVVGDLSRVGMAAVVANTSIPVGKYFIGDFANGAKVIEYTGMTLDWADDVETKLKNQIVLIAQEEVILAVENPWAFSYGSLAALKTAITKA